MKSTFISDHAEGVVLAVKVQPRASRTEVAGSTEGELKIRVAAPPVDDAANAALLRFVAEKLDCPRGAVRLLRGATSRHKLLLIHDARREAVLAKLAPGS
ncbi:MAG: DUF167 domain-containing protein [Verrucomicrobiota bacterium]|jgi:hypothetical protein